MFVIPISACSLKVVRVGGGSNWVCRITSGLKVGIDAIIDDMLLARPGSVLWVETR